MSTKVVPKGNFTRPRAVQGDNQAVQSVVNDLIRNKNGISVPDTSDLGFILCGKDKTFDLIVSNNSSDDVKIVQFETKAVRREQNVIRLSTDTQIPMSVARGRTAVLKITVQAQLVGHSKELVTLSFGQFKIATFIEFEVTDPLLSDMMPSSQGRACQKLSLIHI